MSADVTDATQVSDAGLGESAAGLPLRPELLGASPYGAPQLDVPVRLNTNENTHDVPPEVVRAVADAVAREAARAQPLPRPRVHRGCGRRSPATWVTASPPAQVWAGNGSNEVLQHVLQAFGGPGRVAMGFTPSYAMYPLYCRGTGTGWVDGLRGAPRTPGATLRPGARGRGRAGPPGPAPTSSCWRAPTTRPAPPSDLDVVDAVYAATDGVVVVDEAYAEFARPGTPSALRCCRGRERLAVSRTMSKAFAFAGARVGYLAADPAFCDALRLVRLPYHLSTLTQAAAGRRDRAPRRAAGDGRGDQGAARPDRRRAGGARRPAGAERRELRALRRPRRRPRGLGGAARARRAGPRRRAARPPAGQRRHRGRDDRLPRGGRRGAATRCVEDAR